MSGSLILPRHVGEARQREKAEARSIDPATESMARPEGALNFPDDWFEAEKARIRARIGWVLPHVRVVLNQVLVAAFIPPSELSVAGGEGKTIVLPESYTKEYEYQGTTGLVLKVGPRCHEDSPNLTWTEEDKFAEGDWVLFRRGSSNFLPLKINGVSCYHFMDERFVRMILPRPDVVW